MQLHTEVTVADSDAASGSQLAPDQSAVCVLGCSRLMYDFMCLLDESDNSIIEALTRPRKLLVLTQAQKTHLNCFLIKWWIVEILFCMSQFFLFLSVQIICVWTELNWSYTHTLHIHPEIQIQKTDIPWKAAECSYKLLAWRFSPYFALHLDSKGVLLILRLSFQMVFNSKFQPKCHLMPISLQTFDSFWYQQDSLSCNGEKWNDWYLVVLLCRTE